MNNTIKSIYIILTILLCMAGFNPAFAQDAEPVASYREDTAKDQALRVTSEVGMGALFGTIAASVPLVTGVTIQYMDFQKNPFFPKQRPYLYPLTMALTAILYPAGVASGAILGGYLTDTKCGYWEPFVGAYAGALIADVTAYFLSDDAPVFSAVLVIVLPLVTTAIAMETSHALRDNRDRAKYHDARRSRALMPLSIKFAF